MYYKRIKTSSGGAFFEINNATDGYVAYFTGPSSMSGDSNLMWDSNNNKLSVAGGDISLNVGNKLIFDGDAANDYIYAAAEGQLYFNTQGATRFEIGTGNTIIYQNTRIRSDISLGFGNSFDQTITYNLATSDVTWNDGTNDVITIPDDSNEVRLLTGGKLVFDGDATANDYIYSPSDNLISIYIGGVNTILCGSNYLNLRDNIGIAFGTGLYQRIRYNSATSDVTWNDGTNDVLTIPDDSNKVVLSGGSILSNTGTITLGGTGGTNNENLTLDFESVANRVTINSGTSINRLDIGGSVGFQAYTYTATTGYQAGSTYDFKWHSRSRMYSPADGQIQLTDAGLTGGAVLDVTTADTLTIKDQAGTGAGYLRTSKVVEANTDVAAAPNALTADESFSVLTNEGTAAENHHTLPTAAAGLTYTFVVQDANGIQVNANAGDTIRVAASVSAAAGDIASATVGDCITLVAINATEWVATSYVGTWTVT